MIVLDTHAWLWWCDDPGRLSSHAREVIADAAGIGISAMSCYELAALATRGRVELDPDAGVWIADALANPSTIVLPVDADIAIAGAQIPRDDFPGDPADRMIYATARVHGIPLVTKDRALRAFDPRGTVW
jgi:PIN domain nuclease of toxin-antitoxin system